MSLADTIAIRPAQTCDAEQVIALIDRCFQQYTGCVLDLPGIDADLLQIPHNFTKAGGAFWIAEEKKSVIGSIGFTPSGSARIELKRLYVMPGYRRCGLATRLLEHVLDAALSYGAEAIDLWSDTRFLEAHRFYERHGFTMTGDERYLNDPSNTTEYCFSRPLQPEARNI